MLSSSLRQAAARVREEIAVDMIRSACWTSATHCTWRVLQSKTFGKEPEYELAGPSLYRGAGGIALFLADTFASSPQMEIRRTVEGAAAHALASWSERTDRSLGLFSGAAGLLLLVTRMRAAGLDVGPRSSNDLLDAIEAGLERMASADVIDGTSGILLALAERCANAGADAHEYQLLKAYGEHLLASVTVLPIGWAWERIRDGSRELVGLAHGTSGPILACVSCASILNDSRYLFAALEGVRHEESEFDAREQNWRDLRNIPLGINFEAAREGRSLPTIGDAVRYEPTFMTAWCHGAPGIGIARGSLSNALCSDALMAQTAAALNTTASSIGNAGNASLCHGSAGNALAVYEAMLAGGRVELGIDAVTTAAESLVAQVEAGTRWKSGAWAQRPDPSLMLGDAGIAWFLGRIAGIAAPVPGFYAPIGAHKPRDDAGEKWVAEQSLSRIVPKLWSKIEPEKQAIIVGAWTAESGAPDASGASLRVDALLDCVQRMRCSAEETAAFEYDLFALELRSEVSDYGWRQAQRDIAATVTPSGVTVLRFGGMPGVRSLPRHLHGARFGDPTTLILAMWCESEVLETVCGPLVKQIWQTLEADGLWGFDAIVAEILADNDRLRSDAGAVREVVARQLLEMWRAGFLFAMSDETRTLPG